MESVPALVGKRWVTQWVLWMGSVGFREPKKDGRHPGCGFLQSFQSCSCGRGELGVAESSGCHVHGQVGRESLICRCLLLASSAQKPEGRGVKWFPEEQGRKRQKGGPNEGCLHRSFPLPSPLSHAALDVGPKRGVPAERCRAVCSPHQEQSLSSVERQHTVAVALGSLSRRLATHEINFC